MSETIDKKGRKLTKTSLDSEFTTEGEPKIKVSAYDLKKILEELLIETRLQTELLDKRKQSVELLDNDGIPFGVGRVDNSIKSSPSDFFLEIAKGKIAGHTCVNKFGEAPSGVQTTATDIWDRADATPTQQIWVAPTLARTHTIASTDAGDTAGGAGARTVMVFGLTSWDTKEVSETVTMNTGSPPVTVNSYVIIYRMRVVTSGATSVNIGTITATAAGDGTVTAAIRPSEGTTHMAIYGWPSMQSLYLLDWSGSINKASGAAGTINFKIVYNPEPDARLNHFSVRREKGVQSTGTSDTVWPLNYLKLDGPGIIKIQGIASAADIDGSAGFDGYLVDNNI